MKKLITLWKFSRPHTIIGSVISIFTLFYIICEKRGSIDIPYLLMALIIGITCNIFIVGINQIADVKIDLINKPKLPIPSGELSIKGAKIIVSTSICISLGIAIYLNVYLFLIIALSAFIGWAYSMPPIHLKHHHITAAIAIATVRGLLLNAGGFMVFNYLINNEIEIPDNVRTLSVFIVVFSIVISWFKDLADIKGDSTYNIKTFAIVHSSKTALICGNILVGLAYFYIIYSKSVDYSNSILPSFETKMLLYGHMILFILFIVNGFSISLKEQESIKKFYKRFWWFFFAEYLLYLSAYAIK